MNIFKLKSFLLIRKLIYVAVKYFTHHVFYETIYKVQSRKHFNQYLFLKCKFITLKFILGF